VDGRKDAAEQSATDSHLSKLERDARAWRTTRAQILISRVCRLVNDQSAIPDTQLAAGMQLEFSYILVLIGAAAALSGLAIAVLRHRENLALAGLAARNEDLPRANYEKDLAIRQRASSSLISATRSAHR
jgi:hypothetical protein